MVFGSRAYYLIAIILILISIVAFMLSFEKKKPDAREVVTLAVITAMAIIGRVIFFMTPQFKPCAAVIIICGIMLGKQAGFLCGALTAFVSDFFYGQGPWTPWQMIAFGLIGLISAILFQNRRIIYNKLVMCIYGFLITFILYGLIMDTATVLISTDTPRLKAFIAAYTSGVFFNAVHGISTVVFLFVLSGEMFKKLERMKIKYNMY